MVTLRQVILMGVFIFKCIIVVGQTPITYTEAENALRKNNLLLLAEQYNITAAQANVIQAKIWDLPVVSGEFNFINPQYQKVFDVGGNGQKALAIQQLIYLGGKRKNQIEFAKSNIGIAELQLEQLLRNLKFELQKNFYATFFDELNVNSINVQLSKLDTLLVEYQIQANKGNVALKEVVRLQNLVVSLHNERNDIIQNIIEQKQQIKLITGIDEDLKPIVVESDLVSKFNQTKYTLASLKEFALEKNPEYLTALKITESQDLYLKWQKSLAKPDLTAGLSYDQRGGAFINQTNITFGIPLAFWNRNKGNIKIAEAQLNQSNINIDYKKQEVYTKLSGAFNAWQQQQNQMKVITANTLENLSKVYEGEINNFTKRNLTLLEFTDFMESYNQTINQINEMKKQLILAGLNINYVANTEVF